MTELEKPYDRESDLTVLWDPDPTRFKMARWAPWEWIVYEFEEHKDRVPAPVVWPKPDIRKGER